jgi:hypothetical protein
MLKKGPYKDNEEAYKKARKIRKEEGLGYKRISQKLSELGYDDVSWSTISNWVGDIKHSKEKQAKSISKALRNKSVKECKSKSSIRDYLKRSKENCCENCGRSKWMKKEITLEIHRTVDKDYSECEEKDIEWLCPNCHSLTDNWRGKG